MQAEELFDELRSFFMGIKESPAISGALETYDAVIQFRVVEKCAGHPMHWYGGTSGDFYWVRIEDGKLSFGRGDVREKEARKGNWKNCILVEVDRSALIDIMQGRLRPADAYFDDRLLSTHFYVGGASGQWPLALLRLGQVAKHGYWNYLPGERKKSFLWKRFP